MVSISHQSGQAALNLDLAGLEIARFVTRVFRLQANPAGFFQQRFQRGLLFLDQGHDDLAMIGRIGTFDHHRVTIGMPASIIEITDNLEREMLARPSMLAGTSSWFEDRSAPRSGCRRRSCRGAAG